MLALDSLAFSPCVLIRTHADEDRSGTLTRGNIVKGLETIAGIFLSSEEKRGVFSLLDRDNNHRVCWEEFAVMWNHADLVDVAIGEMSPELKAHALAIRTLDFSVVARKLRAAAYTGGGNFSGGVSLAHFFSLLGDHQHATLQWGQFMHSIRHSQVTIERMSDEVLASLFLAIDTDGDGAIEFSEFEGFIEEYAARSGVKFKHSRQLHEIASGPIRLVKPESFATRGHEVRWIPAHFFFFFFLLGPRSLRLPRSPSLVLFAAFTGRVGAPPRAAAPWNELRPLLPSDGRRSLGDDQPDRVHPRPPRRRWSRVHDGRY